MMVLRRRRTLALGLALAAGLASGGTMIGDSVRASASQANPAEQLLERTRRAAQSQDFAGVVAVEWRDAGGRHSERVAVRGVRGVLSFGDEGQVVGAGTRRFVAADHGWTALWTTGGGQGAPAPSRTWRLTLKTGPLVASRPTLVIAAADRRRRVRERLFVDAGTDLLLRREQLDERGHLERLVEFTRLDEAPSAAAQPPPRAPKRARYQGPRAVGGVRSPFRAPGRMGHGYELVGRYRRPDGTVQLFYSDGLFGVSVFEQDGRLDWSRLPPGGRTRTIAGHDTRAYGAPTGTVVVWEADGVVYTCVSDASIDQVQGLLADLSPSPHPSVARRVADFLLGPFSW